MDHGQKGYGWALTAEALSQGLSGRGRADEPKGMTNAIFLQLIDPEAFAGLDAFNRQTSAIADACRASPPRSGDTDVRLPGAAALQRFRKAQAEGVELRRTIFDALRPWASKLNTEMPRALLR